MCMDDYRVNVEDHPEIIPVLSERTAMTQIRLIICFGVSDITAEIYSYSLTTN